MPDLNDQQDLTRDDYLAVNTTKVFPGDDTLPAPPQSPRWVPESVVDERGEPL